MIICIVLFISQIPNIGDLSNDIPVAESTEIEVDPYGASTIVQIPDILDRDTSFDISDRNIVPVNLIEEEYVYTINTGNICIEYDKRYSHPNDREIQLVW